MKLNMVCLNIFYPAEFWPTMDDDIDRIVGHHSMASGMYMNNERDLSYEISSMNEAKDIRQKILDSYPYVSAVIVD